jgi:DNA-binding NarL/FixJ family response regulator
MDGTDTDSEKVEQLTEIFYDIAGGSTTTEKQDEDRWSTSQSGSDETVRTIIREMIDEYGIQTSLDEDELVTLVQEYHDGESDKEIARALGTPNRDKTVTRARRNLHLFRDSDFDAPFSLDRLRELLDQDASTAEIADALSASESTIRTYTRVIATENEASSVDHKYQHRFEQALDDSANGDSDDLFSETLSASARASGLEDALGDS